MKKKIPVEVYSRVVGYFRPISQWNNGKREEFKNRHNLSIPKIETKPIDTKNEKI